MRGGQTDAEIAHADALLGAEAESIWGWAMPAGQRRVAARVAWFAKVLGFEPGMRVLECGCGTGVFTTRLAAHGIDLTSADIAAPLLARAAERCANQRVAFVRTNLEDPHELEDGAYDALCGVSVLHHLDTTKALPALLAKLRPGGRFAFSEPNLLNPINKYMLFTPNLERRRRYGVSPGEMAFVPSELRAELQRAGFVVDALEHRDFLHPSTPAPLIPIVEGLQAVAEALPGIRRISGSLWVSGYRPGGERP